jgi:hypothetical protein
MPGPFSPPRLVPDKKPVCVNRHVYEHVPWLTDVDRRGAIAAVMNIMYGFAPRALEFAGVGTYWLWMRTPVYQGWAVLSAGWCNVIGYPRSIKVCVGDWLSSS